jgi:hypothetical protein
MAGGVDFMNDKMTCTELHCLFGETPTALDLGQASIKGLSVTSAAMNASNHLPNQGGLESGLSR